MKKYILVFRHGQQAVQESDPWEKGNNEKNSLTSKFYCLGEFLDCNPGKGDQREAGWVKKKEFAVQEVSVGRICREKHQKGGNYRVRENSRAL